MRHNPFYNPYAKPGSDPHGKACFYIYNDDGTQAVGPTGPKFCYSADKAQEIIKKVEAAGQRVSPSSVSPGPRPQASGAAPGGYVRDRVREAAEQPIRHRYKVGDHLVGRERGTWSPNNDLYRIVSVSPNSVMLQKLEIRDQSGTVRRWHDTSYQTPTGQTSGPPRRAIINEAGEFQAYRLERWDGKPIEYNMMV
jgi:hypothetical protein